MAAKKIALFIDADNISSKYGKQILAAVESRGEVFIRRIYGNWEKNSLRGWNECILNFSLRAVQQPDFVTGKNATDMCLTIDAMDVLHEGKAEIFVLVSNDSDFTPLVIRLREGGMTIIGLGNSNASNAFRAACSEFIDLDAPATVKPANKPKVSPALAINAAVKNTAPPVKEIVPPVQMSLFTENPAPVEPERPKSSKVVSITRATDIQSDDKIRKLHNILHETAKTHADNDGFVAMCWAGQSIHEHLNFSVKDFGYGSLYKFVRAFPDRYEVIHRNNGDNFCYRCRVKKTISPTDDRLNQLHDIIREAATAYQDDDGFSLLNHAGQQIKRKNLNFSVKDFGYGQLREFISAFPDRYEVAHDTNGGQFRYRCKQM